MFDGLRKKFSNFVDSLAKKEEQKVEEANRALPAQEQKREHAQEAEHHEVGGDAQAPIGEHAAAHEEVAGGKEGQEAATAVEAPKPAEPGRIGHGNGQEEVGKVHANEPEARRERIPQPAARDASAKKARDEPRIIKPKVTLGTKLRGIVFREITVSDRDIEPFMEQLRISLIQSDVNYDVVEKILGKIHSELVSKPIDSKDLSKNIALAIRNSIFEILNKGAEVDIVNLARQKKAGGEPFKILFIGPNGAGKTTTMAKIARLMLDNGMTCVMSASDTFRAAAIEQTAYHAGRLGIGVIKGRYGADPASVAFDAIAHAKAHRIDVVLIDSAGRQETNKSLMEEVKKIVRIAQPDLKIFVGESIVGNALLNQVMEFNEAVGLDGIVLTKLDADAKGGNTLSILSETQVPMLFFGTGEGYDALMAYDPNFIVDNIMPLNN